MFRYSIITVSCNDAQGLEQTIQSVIAQTYKNYEFIIIDGGSQDNSPDIIEKYASYIKYWVSEKDKGIYDGMNKGVLAAHGDYCIFMNSGDTFYNEEVLQHIEYACLQEDICCGDICYGQNHIIPNPENVTMRTFYKHSLFHQASFIRTSLFKNHLYDEGLESAADWKWFVEVLVFENASYRHIPLVVARYAGGGLSEKYPEIGQGEIEKELKSWFPERILQDYEDYVFGCTPYRRMMNGIEQVPFLKKNIYKLNKIILKILNLKWKAEWIKKI